MTTLLHVVAILMQLVMRQLRVWLYNCPSSAYHVIGLPVFSPPTPFVESHSRIHLLISTMDIARGEYTIRTGQNNTPVGRSPAEHRFIMPQPIMILSQDTQAPKASRSSDTQEIIQLIHN